MRAELLRFWCGNFKIFVTMATGVGWCDTNFTYTVKSTDPENPLFGARILMISHIEGEL